MGYLMRKFYGMIDLSENLSRALNAIRGIVGAHALVLSVALFIVVAGLAPFVWYLDLGSTMWATTLAIGFIAPQIPEEYAAWVGVIALAITLLPTAIELFTARFAMSIPAASVLVFGFSMLDMVTDAPRVRMLMLAYEPSFSMLGAVGTIAWWMLHVPMLFLASFGLELLVIIFTIVAILLLLSSQQEVKHVGGASGRSAAR